MDSEIRQRGPSDSEWDPEWIQLCSPKSIQEFFVRGKKYYQDLLLSRKAETDEDHEAAVVKMHSFLELPELIKEEMLSYNLNQTQIRAILGTLSNDLDSMHYRLLIVATFINSLELPTLKQPAAEIINTTRKDVDEDLRT